MLALGTFWHLLEESGLHEVLSTVYAPNAVNAMLQGKAVLRAVRGHFLVDAALNAMLISDTFHVPLPHSDPGEEEEQCLGLESETELQPVSKRPPDVKAMVSDAVTEFEGRADLEDVSELYDQLLKDD